MVKKSNKIVFIIILLSIIAIATGYFFIHKNRKKDETNSEIGEEYRELTEEEIEDIDAVIESKFGNKIEKDGIEAKSIQLKNYGNQLEVKTTFVNNNDETVKGFSFEIELLDNSGKRMTTIAGNYDEPIEKNGEAEVENYVMDLKNMSKIKNAKIVNIELGSSKENIEKAFEEMTPDLEE